MNLPSESNINLDQSPRQHRSLGLFSKRGTNPPPAGGAAAGGDRCAGYMSISKIHVDIKDPLDLLLAPHLTRRVGLDQPTRHHLWCIYICEYMIPHIRVGLEQPVRYHLYNLYFISYIMASSSRSDITCGGVYVYL